MKFVTSKSAPAVILAMALCAEGFSQETRVPPPAILRPIPTSQPPSSTPLNEAPRIADSRIPSIEGTTGSSVDNNRTPLGNPSGSFGPSGSLSPSGDANNTSTEPSRSSAQRGTNLTLPTKDGQYWMEYDIKPYTQTLKTVDRPQQAIIDWILRDTGTDVWFNEPFGVLTADRTTLRVYHNDGMQQTVKGIYERFVNGTLQPQTFGLRIITIGNPNWRQKGLAWMKSVDVQSPGMSGWLLSKENSALLMAQLRSRSDVKETPLPELISFNGQNTQINQLRSRNYVREYTMQQQPYPAYIPVSDEIQEGYQLEFSPLLSNDQRSVDVSLKCSIDQVERLNNVQIDLPTAGGGNQSVTINVPQLSSWRLHERFRWPADQVLILSCGVVASPGQSPEQSLLGNPPAPNALFGLGRLIPTVQSNRADALLVMEYKGPAASSQGSTVPSTSGQTPTPVANVPSTSSSISRGRY